MTGWVSVPELVVDQTGAVPPVVLSALAGLGTGSTWDSARRNQVQAFLAEVCADLAESRRQVVRDRRELDRLRAWWHRLDEDERGRGVA